MGCGGADRTSPPPQSWPPPQDQRPRQNPPPTGQSWPSAGPQSGINREPGHSYRVWHSTATGVMSTFVTITEMPAGANVEVTRNPQNLVAKRGLEPNWQQHVPPEQWQRLLALLQAADFWNATQQDPCVGQNPSGTSWLIEGHHGQLHLAIMRAYAPSSQLPACAAYQRVAEYVMSLVGIECSASECLTEKEQTSSESSAQPSR